MKNSMRTVAVILFLFFSMSTYAAGNIHVDGRLRNLTEDSVQIQKGEWILTISKKALSKEVLNTLKAKKSNDPIDFWIPFKAITDTKKVASTN